jgi:hypothetical protein
MLQPTTSLVYLGLNIYTIRGYITPTTQCLRHRSCRHQTRPTEDHGIRRVDHLRHGLASISCNIDSLQEHLLGSTASTTSLSPSTQMNASPLRSVQLYTDATPTSAAAVFLGPPRKSMVQHYTDARNIAFAEMVAALKGLIWTITTLLHQRISPCLREPYFRFTLCRNSGSPPPPCATTFHRAS